MQACHSSASAPTPCCDNDCSMNFTGTVIRQSPSMQVIDLARIEPPLVGNLVRSRVRMKRSATPLYIPLFFEEPSRLLPHCDAIFGLYHQFFDDRFDLVRTTHNGGRDASVESVTTSFSNPSMPTIAGFQNAAASVANEAIVVSLNNSSTTKSQSASAARTLSCVGPPACEPDSMSAGLQPSMARSI